ncbi:MAG TPA: hypothetical protein P5555_04965 [Candidatus Paceibacterota bacterium]|nr:hypothetical protein [Verrucomicrobiota bacterium]HRZ44522.1 hypothetical protein [Candidatus Paceibacterota bacterium]HRZ91770.1 hypothetical protein [Candidatus Paceibacterota bacterium]
MNRPSNQRQAPAGSDQRHSRSIVWIGVLLLIGSAALILMKERFMPAAPPPAPQDSRAPAMAGPAPTNPAASIPPDPRPLFAKLVGRWVRPDGGYILEIRRVEPQGRVDAGYFNPRPIRIARAEASVAGPTAKLFIELQDEGYPGCTYRLAYDPVSDMLAGEYLQAAMQQTFEVVFSRLQ